MNKWILLFFLSISYFSFTSAQVPDKFYNLQILPKDISKDKLIEVMKSFTFGLGVRCVFCHEGEDGQPLSTFNFESDIKTSKQKARIMMTMTHDINTKYLSALSEFSSHVHEVKCVTCHRGAEEPELLEDVLFNKVKRKGLPEAVSTYNKLYERYYGGYTYDFRDHTLVLLTEKLSEEKMYVEAIEFAKLNVDKYPESGTAYYGLAEAYALNGDKEKAVENYKKALEYMPKAEDMIMKKIEELQKK
jgi:tetratricopeptide (TPR) repeat protein